MKVLIKRISRTGSEELGVWSSNIDMDKSTVQECVNRDFSMFIEGGGRVDVLSKIVNF